MNQNITKLDYTQMIQDLGVMNQHLISRSLDLGMVSEAKELQQIDEHLIWLLYHKAAKFDFMDESAV